MADQLPASRLFDRCDHVASHTGPNVFPNVRALMGLILGPGAVSFASHQHHIAHMLRQTETSRIAMPGSWRACLWCSSVADNNARSCLDPSFLVLPILSPRPWAHKPLRAVRDLTFGFEASYAQLLTDVLHLRNQLRQLLDPAIVDKIDREEEVFILLLGPAGYEFTVGFLALMALGAIIVPISPDLPVKEATYFATKSQAAAVITADRCLALGSGLEDALRHLGAPTFCSLAIRSHSMQACLDPADILVSSEQYMDLNRSGYAIFTSGTTGPPQGAVKRRGSL
ncbi:hypothetical protein LTR49_028838, partial [Elasticomyces elasticus]